jgi:TRAP-type C4-dicarboxylate transport system substrate-binding protein
MKKTLISLAAVALTSLTGMAQAQTVLTVSSWVPPTHGLSVAQKEWCDAVTARTSNRVRCNILPRAVTPPVGTYDAIRNGLADVSFTVHGYTPGRFVLTQMVEFPFMGDRA